MASISQHNTQLPFSLKSSIMILVQLYHHTLQQYCLNQMIRIKEDASSRTENVHDVKSFFRSYEPLLLAINFYKHTFISIFFSIENFSLHPIHLTIIIFKLVKCQCDPFNCVNFISSYFHGNKFHYMISINYKEKKNLRNCISTLLPRSLHAYVK